MTDKVHFSSVNREAGTPRWLYDRLDKVFSFTIDVCASELNHKHERYWTVDDNCFTKSWADEICWMNPPYGDPEMACKSNCKKKGCQDRGWHTDHYIPGIIDFMQKAYTESAHAVVVCLVPARTDNVWFQTYGAKADQILFIAGRLVFEGEKQGAPFPSCLLLFDPRHPFGLDRFADLGFLR